MNFKEICALIELVAQKKIPLVEVEHGGVRIKIQGSTLELSSTPSQVPPQEVILSETPSEKGIPSSLEEENHHIITAPMVGTFYRAPSPTDEPFVEVGSKVSKGTVLCIIEAMKLMNEIESDIAGEVVAIYPENGQPVEFGQKLFAIKPL